MKEITELLEVINQFRKLQVTTHEICAKISRLQAENLEKCPKDFFDLGGHLRDFKDDLNELRKEVEARFEHIASMNGEYLVKRSLQEGAIIKGIGDDYKCEYKHKCLVIVPKKETEEWDELLGELNILIPEDRSELLSLSYARIRDFALSLREAGKPLKNLQLFDQFSAKYRKR